MNTFLIQPKPDRLNTIGNGNEAHKDLKEGRCKNDFNTLRELRGQSVSV